MEGSGEDTPREEENGCQGDADGEEEAGCVLSEITPISRFHDIPIANATYIVARDEAFQNDTSRDKVFLANTEYCTTEGVPWVFPVVRKVRQQIASDPTLDHEELPETGLAEFNRVITELLLGSESVAIVQNRAGSIQGIGSTGALYIGVQFLKYWYNPLTNNPISIYIPLPTWEPQQQLFLTAGFEDLNAYRFVKDERNNLDLREWLEVLENAPEYSIIFLHTSSHDPRAPDPTPCQWKQVAEVMKRKKHFPFFSITCQGLASGDLDRDVWAIRYFVTEKFEMFCAQSFSRNFGLYRERIGGLTMVTRDNHSLVRMRYQMARIVRATYNSPPFLGARIITTVLSNPALFAEWKENLKTIVERLMLIREKLKDELRLLGTPGNWDHITQQHGTYIVLGLNASQINYMQEKHVYLTIRGQMNASKLNNSNIPLVARAVHEAVTAEL